MISRILGLALQGFRFREGLGGRGSCNFKNSMALGVRLRAIRVRGLSGLRRRQIRL